MARKSLGKIRQTFTLDKNIIKMLEDYANHHNITKTDVVEQALIYYIVERRKEIENYKKEIENCKKEINNCEKEKQVLLKTLTKKQKKKKLKKPN